jgi:hypothetical protein
MEMNAGCSVPVAVLPLEWMGRRGKKRTLEDGMETVSNPDTAVCALLLPFHDSDQFLLLSWDSAHSHIRSSK